MITLWAAYDYVSAKWINWKFAVSSWEVYSAWRIAHLIDNIKYVSNKLEEERYEEENFNCFWSSEKSKEIRIFSNYHSNIVMNKYQ